MRRLTPTRHDIAELDVVGDVGTTGWAAGAGALPWGQPTDQRIDDARSLTHDWPVTELAEVAGTPTVAVRVRSSSPVAHVAVKLCDVQPDGTSALVTRGMFNLTHRGCWPVDPDGVGVRRPEPVVPGEWMDVTVGLGATTWTLEPGHALRLVVAGSDWPNAWPSPGPVRLGLDWSGVAVDLPVWTNAPSSTHAFTLVDAPSQQPVDDSVVWRIEHDVIGRQTCAVTRSGGRSDGEHGAVVDAEYSGTVGVSTTDPAHAWSRGRATYLVTWPEATVRSEAVVEVRSDAEAYHVAVELSVHHDGVGFADRHWTERIARVLQ